MITGFNTDIEYEGTVYHVQTEDKGLDTPVILSLVYVGGAILASKRSPYDDLVVSGFDAAALSERLNRQHKLICAAITAGRIEELKRLSRNGGGGVATRRSSRRATKAQPPQVAAGSAEPVAETKAETKAETRAAPEVSTVSAKDDAKPAAEVSTVSAQPDASPAAEATAKAEAAAASNGNAAAANAEAATQTPAEAAKSELPPWFETTAESFASILEKVAASEAAQAEAARVEAEKAEAARVEAARVEAAEAERRRRFPPKDALVASGVAQPADAPVETAAPATHPEAQATDHTPRPEVTEIIPVEVEGELHVSLMEERDYRAGEIVTLRVRVARGPIDAREAVPEAAVTVKVLGTEFRPLILTSKTDRDGVAVVHAWLPRFTSGRAAILVRAAHDGFTAELRRAVRHL